MECAAVKVTMFANNRYDSNLESASSNDIHSAFKSNA